MPASFLSLQTDFFIFKLFDVNLSKKDKIRSSFPKYFNRKPLSSTRRHSKHYLLSRLLQSGLTTPLPAGSSNPLASADLRSPWRRAAELPLGQSSRPLGAEAMLPCKERTPAPRGLPPPSRPCSDPRPSSPLRTLLAPRRPASPQASNPPPRSPTTLQRAPGNHGGSNPKTTLTEPKPATPRATSRVRRRRAGPLTRDRYVTEHQLTGADGGGVVVWRWRLFRSRVVTSVGLWTRALLGLEAGKGHSSVTSEGGMS